MSPLPQDGLFHTRLLSLFSEIAGSSHLTEGKMVKAFEEEVERQTGKFAIAVSSCGAGLFALYRVACHKTQIAVPTNTFYATGGMAREAGMDVRLVDVAPDRFSCGVEQYQRVAEDFDVIALTHVGGKLADEYDAVVEWCGEDSKFLIEDCAHALGVPGAGLKGHAAVFSLYPTKAVPAGEGGVIITDDDVLAEELRVFRNYGKKVVDGVIRYSEGFNLRMDEWTAAVSLLQMQRIGEIMALRQEAAEQLMEVIAPHPEFDGTVSNWYKYPAYRKDVEALGFTKRTGPIYQVSDQLTTAMFGVDPLPNAAALADAHVCLPLGERLYEGKSADEIAAWLRGEVA